MSTNNFAADSTKINKETFKIFSKEYRKHRKHRKHPLKQIKKLISGIKALLGAIYDSFVNSIDAAVLTLSPYVGFVIAYLLVTIAFSVVMYYVPYLSIGIFVIMILYFILTILGF